jgi:hypothetical protein
MPSDPIHLYAPVKLDAHTNARGHWRTLKKRTDKEKQITAWLLRSRVLPDLPVVVTFARISPRDLDDDNLPSAFKYVRDTIAAHYGTHDGTNAPITWRYSQRRARKDETARYGFIITIETQP